MLGYPDGVTVQAMKAKHAPDAGPDDCWKWTGARRLGYGRLNVSGKTWNAHRLAYTLAVGPIPVGINVLHSCDEPPCFNPAHLSLGTQTDNMRDMRQKNRWRAHIGSGHGMAKLTEEQIKDIRQRRMSGERLQLIAESYGVTKALVHQIVHRKIWKHVA